MGASRLFGGPIFVMHWPIFDFEFIPYRAVQGDPQLELRARGQLIISQLTLTKPEDLPYDAFVLRAGPRRGK
jgi:hypothetical protein